MPAMNDHDFRLMLTRRQLLGRTATGIGTAALASLLNPSVGRGAESKTIGLPAKVAMESLESAGISPKLPGGAQLSLDPANMVLTVHTVKGEIIFTPTLDAESRITWACANGQGLKAELLPDSCRAVPAGE